MRERVNDHSVVAMRGPGGQYPRVAISVGELVTTGQAAVLLRVSRARVVDLCLRGLLPYVRVGGQPRLRRADVEALLRPLLTRDQMVALWLHRAIAGKVVADPPAVLAAARANLQRLRRLHPDGPDWEWLDRWDAVLDDGVESVLEALTSPARGAVELRRNSPFAGVLSETERRAVVRAYADSRRDHARPVRRETVEQVLKAV
jgi:excisionase family DNA binding protein